jgi:hypothetical protein
MLGSYIALLAHFKLPFLLLLFLLFFAVAVVVALAAEAAAAVAFVPLPALDVALEVATATVWTAAAFEVTVRPKRELTAAKP